VICSHALRDKIQSYLERIIVHRFPFSSLFQESALHLLLKLQEDKINTARSLASFTNPAGNTSMIAIHTQFPKLWEVDEITPARKESRNDDPKQPAEEEYESIPPFPRLAVVDFRLWAQGRPLRLWRGILRGTQRVWRRARDAFAEGVGHGGVKYVHGGDRGGEEEARLLRDHVEEAKVAVDGARPSHGFLSHRMHAIT
jgi:hypothetical protein